MGISRKQREELFEQESFNPVTDMDEIRSIVNYLIPSEKKSPISDRLIEKVNKYFEEEEKNKK